MKTVFKLIYSLIYRLFLPVLVYTPGRIYHGEFLTCSRVGIIQFLESWSEHITGNVLDVGVGTWTYPRNLLHSRCEYIATDCFEHPNVNLISDIHTLTDTLLPESFDFVICLDVLEHVQHPWVAIKQLYAVLKPGGILLLTTPFNYRLHGNSQVKDYWRFTADGLSQLLIADAGFAKVDIAPNGHSKFPFGFSVVAYK